MAENLLFPSANDLDVADVVPRSHLDRSPIDWLNRCPPARSGPGSLWEVVPSLTAVRASGRWLLNVESPRLTGRALIDVVHVAARAEGSR